ncbi:Treslin [Amphibalanus amphitrite]|uniref:Treslin n=1 Tax=Amphibalanus amphitrite TaxID=1232801 RepID=A0A6A4XAN1_AMPAM|nr:Treslin [Amphibalanus amphitrite]
MMARAAQMTAVRQRRGQRQQAAEQQRQTWRRQEKERRMREQQQRALRDVSGVTDTAELVGRLQAMKERCIAGHEQDVVAAVQSVINPLLLHIKAMEGVDTASHLRLMLKDHFLPDKRRVAQLYGDDRARRVREYQYEVVVLLEACWVLGGEMSEGDKEQLLDLLRMTSLHGSPAAMTEFMELTMVESYQHTQPDLLLELYEELCQPPPAALLQLLSPSRAPPDSWRPPSSSRPPGSSGGPPGSVSSLLSGSGPGSQAVLLARSAALSRQPSLLDAAKKRQIMVPKPKELSRHASHSSGSSRSMVLASAAAARGAAAAAARAGPSSGSAQRPPSGSKTGEKRSLSSGRVKRNLFESLGRSPRRSQQGATRTAVSPQRRSLNSSFVPETPAQKNRTRRRTDSGTAVVKESPEAKEADGDVGLTPRRASQRLTLTRRASFYNLEEGSRHFARARHTVLA